MADDDEHTTAGDDREGELLAHGWRLLGEQAGPPLPLFRPRFDLLENPRNGYRMRGLVLASDDWVNCVAVTGDGRLVMVRQYRIGIRATTVETPGGMVDPGEQHGDAARRELLEETGYGGGTWRYLGAVQPNPAIHDHLCHHWLGEGVELQTEQALGGGEHIDVRLMSLDEVRAAFASGELRHVLALSALSRVYPLWELAGG